MSIFRRAARTILLPEMAKPLVESTSLGRAIERAPACHFMKFGDSNPERIFYVIRRSPGSGFFSNLAYVLNHLKICDGLGLTPAVDFENFPTLYNEDNVIAGTRNAWEYYFEPVSPYSLDEIYSSCCVVITDGKWYPSMPMSITQDDGLLATYTKYIKPKQEIVSECASFADRHFRNEKVLAIHFRGQELRTARGHPFPPTKKQILSRAYSLITEHGFTKVFVSTESLDYFGFLQKSFGTMTCSFPSHRSDRNSYLERPRLQHRYQLGRDILRDTALGASGCSSLRRVKCF